MGPEGADQPLMLDDLIIGVSQHIADAGVPVIVVLMYFLMRLVRQVRDKVHETNGSIIAMQAWQRSHEKLDDERHTAMLQGMRDIWQEINNLRRAS